MIDANRLLSALLTDGRTRRCIAEATCRFVAPGALWSEVERHAPTMARRAGVPEATMRRVAATLLGLVDPVKDADLRPVHPTAMQALGNVDPDDVPYLAAALAVGADAIWSHDRHFDEQDLVPRIDWP